LDEAAKSDWVLVTNNAVEFRGRHRQIELHPGVAFIVPSVRRTQQIELFEAALQDIEADPDLVNTAPDAAYHGDQIPVRRHPLP